MIDQVTLTFIIFFLLKWRDVACEVVFLGILNHYCRCRRHRLYVRPHAVAPPQLTPPPLRCRHNNPMASTTNTPSVSGIWLYAFMLIHRLCVNTKHFLTIISDTAVIEHCVNLCTGDLLLTNVGLLALQGGCSNPTTTVGTGSHYWRNSPAQWRSTRHNEGRYAGSGEKH